MVCIFENDLMLARCMGLYFENTCDPLIIPSDSVSSLVLAIKWLKNIVGREPIILINASMSFRRPPDPGSFEGLKLLREILLEMIPNKQIILYSFDGERVLCNHGGKPFLRQGVKRPFQFFKLPF